VAGREVSTKGADKKKKKQAEAGFQCITRARFYFFNIATTLGNWAQGAGQTKAGLFKIIGLPSLCDAEPPFSSSRADAPDGHGT